MKFIKKPIPVQVEFASEAGVLKTREGSVSYEPGDALMTGVVGERWPIRRAHFERIYEPAAPQKMGEAGRYLKKPMIVTARQIKSSEQVTLTDGQGTLDATPGDWIVESVDGQRWVVGDEIFRRTYEHAPSDVESVLERGGER